MSFFYLHRNIFKESFLLLEYFETANLDQAIIQNHQHIQILSSCIDQMLLPNFLCFTVLTLPSRYYLQPIQFFFKYSTPDFINNFTTCSCSYPC